MKKINSIIIATCIAVLISSCKKDGELIQPKILNGAGVMIGSVQLIRTSTEDSRSFDQSAVLVEVVGTNISATSSSQAKDRYSKFVLTGLDSGYYSLRFSKTGYVTREISGVYHNGTDTTTMKYFTSDSSGTTSYDVVMVFEQHPEVSAKSITAEAIQTIRVDTLIDHGKIRDIRRDTSYSFSSAITLDVNSQTEWSQANYPLGYIAYIDDQPNVASSKLPAKELEKSEILFKAEIEKMQLPFGVYNLGVTPNKVSAIDKSVQKTSNFKLENKVQLYLHVIPYAFQKGFIIEYKPYDPPIEGSYSLMIQKTPITIPIEWK